MSAVIVIHEISMPWALQLLAQEQPAALMERVEGGFNLSQLHEDGTKTLRFLVRSRLPEQPRERAGQERALVIAMPTKKFTESLGDMAKRHRRNGRKKPLRSVSELAQEFGLSPAQLSTYLCSPDSPKPVFKHQSAFGRGNTWYDPKEVRDWMKARGGK